MKSGEFIRKFNITRDTLRYYIKLGLIKPSKNPNGYMKFDEDDEDIMYFILSAKKVGFTLSEIKSVLSDIEGEPCKHQAFLKYIDNKSEQLEKEKKTIIQRQTKLKIVRDSFMKKDCTIKPESLRF